MNIKTKSNKYGETNRAKFNKTKNILNSGNNYFGKDFNSNKKTRGIAIFFWIKLNLFFFLIFLINKIKIRKQKKKSFNTKNFKKKNDINDFIEVLPKISLKNNTTPSLEEIFNSRTLFLFNTNLSVEYLRYIRPINDEEEKQFKKQYYEYETAISAKIFEKREDQYNFTDFAKLCLKEKLINPIKIDFENKPLISLVLPSYNKAEILMKSIRSIQNQSFKNIEIIIIDDCSTDDSKKVFKYLLKTDPRIRIFTHLRNMGSWRSRLDGILYSKAKYILLFDTGDI